MKIKINPLCIDCTLDCHDGISRNRKCPIKIARKSTKNKFMKSDEDKVRLELIPPELNEAIGTILAMGAKKYADRNWEIGSDWGRYYGALQRHLNAWWGGEDLDEESGKSHLWHAGCCIAFLITYEARGIGEDTRSKTLITKQ